MVTRPRIKKDSRCNFKIKANKKEREKWNACKDGRGDGGESKKTVTMPAMMYAYRLLLTVQYAANGVWQVYRSGYL